MGHYHGRSKPYHRQEKSQLPETKIMGSFIFGIGKILSLPFRKKNKKEFLKYESLDKELIKNRFMEVEELIKLGSPSNFQKALIEADKLLDFALKGLGFEGETMADRIQVAQKKFSNYQGIWYAHKLRNQAVHEMDTEILSHEVKKAVKIYQLALRELGAL